MDYFIIFLYIIVFALLRNKWGFFALAAAIISYYFNDHRLFFAVTSLSCMVLCLHKSKAVALSSFVMSVIYYAMAWENLISDVYFLSDFAYTSVSVMLNLALIVSLLRSGRNGVYIADIHVLHDNKLSFTYNQLIQRRQKT